MDYKVTQMTSSMSGNPVANQFEIRTPKGLFFQSYNSIIALVDKKNNIILDEYYHNYSRTTSKYLSRFLGISTQDRKKMIKSKEIKLKNLNK